MNTGLLLRLSLALACLSSTVAGSELRILDDREQAITEPVEVCVASGLSSNCKGQQPRAGLVTIPADFDRITVEGPRHGPATLQRADVGELEGGPLILRRKGLLEVRGLGETKVEGTLFDVEDPDFRYPVRRLDVEPEGNWIPAGGYVVSLESRGSAPDLHLVTVVPGGRVRVSLRSVPGWSLLVRATSNEELPVKGAAAVVRIVSPYEREEVKPRTSETDSHGLVAFVGLDAPIATVSLSHRDFVLTRDRGITATPGTFAYRGVRMRRGGTVVATATLDGSPLRNANCEVVEVLREDPRQAPVARQVKEGQTDTEGIFRATRVPEGSYLLRVRPGRGSSGEGSMAQRAIRVFEEQETNPILELESIRVRGTVYRGEDRMEGYLVQVFPGWQSARARLPSGPVETAVTDEEGEYELTLWEPGEYHFMAGTQPDRLASIEPVWLSAGEAEVDFHLADADIRGVVLDVEGSPVPEAVVQLEQDNHFRFQRGGEDGTFTFPIDDLSGRSGRAVVFAEKDGWGPSERVAVVISEDGPPREPVVLVLTDKNLLRGRVLSASGEPVPGVWVGSFEAVAGRGPRMVGSVSTNPAGAFEVARARGDRSELFLSGPSCPLTSVQVLQSETESLELRCPSAPATLDLILTSPEGAPLVQQELILRRDDYSVVAREVMRIHLALLGLPFVSDGAGHLALVSMAPGRYDLYLAAGASEDTVAAQLPYGYLTSVDLVPGVTVQLEVTAATGLP